MAVWGVDVSVIECGFMRTPMVDGMKSAFHRSYDQNPPQLKQMYGQEWCDHFNEQMDGMMGRANDPQVVIDAYITALSSYKPKIRYNVISWFGWIMTKLPVGIVDIPMQKMFGTPLGAKK